MVLSGVCKEAERAQNSQETPGLPWAYGKEKTHSQALVLIVASLI